MIRILMAAVLAAFLPIVTFAQPSAPPSPVPPSPVPIVSQQPVRVISAACTSQYCKISCVKDKEILVNAVCNNHRSAGGPADGPQPGPEFLPKYLDHYSAECRGNDFGDSMIAVCARIDLINVIKSP